MKSRPILFSAPMVRALLNGSKTQTRREWKYKNGDVVPNQNDLPGMQQLLRDCPYGQPGDRLWVRETWQHLDNVGQRAHEFLLHQKHSRHCFFLADESDPTTKPLSGRWRPSIFMPRWASRITLEVISVRVERLQDISEADAIAEGVQDKKSMILGRNAEEITGPIAEYAVLWESLHGPGSWDANPWVWVIEFKRVEGGAA